MIVKLDYQKFANEAFLRTVDADLLHRFIGRHDVDSSYLDVDLLVTDPAAGRSALAAFLLGPVERCPESMTADLHRIAKLDRSEGLDILLEEVHRVGVSLVADEDRQTATPRNVALKTFMQHPILFAAAEDALDFIQPATLTEFIAPEEGLEADLGPDVLAQLEAAAREIFETALRGEFCNVVTHDDADEVHVSLRHGAHLKTHEILADTTQQIASFREIEKIVLAYSAMEGRLKVWGGTKAHRDALADTFARLALERSGLFKAAGAKRLYTLEPAERAGAAFAFRHGHDEEIDSIRIYEAQANRTAVNPRSGAERTIYSLVVRDTRGEALRLLHEARRDIAYGDGWRLDHLTLKIMMRTAGPRLRTLTVKIKPVETVSFQPYRHQRRVMELLRLNGMMIDAMLATRLWRLSEAGEPAYLLGRPVEPADATLFDHLLARGVLRHAGRQTSWDVCNGCDCGREERPIREINGVPVAVCIMDHNRDEVLTPDDLVTFELSIPDLVETAAKASGLTTPPEPVSRGIWKLCQPQSGPSVYVVPTREVIGHSELIPMLRHTDPTQDLLLLGPPITERRRADLLSARVHHVALADRVSADRKKPMALDLTMPAASTGVPPRLRLRQASLSLNMMNAKPSCLDGNSNCCFCSHAGSRRVSRPCSPPRSVPSCSARARPMGDLEPWFENCAIT